MTTATRDATRRMSDTTRRLSGWTGYAPLDAGNVVRLQAAAADLAEGVRSWRSWTYLAVESVKNSYRRTVLGPWWITLQTMAFILGMAVIFGQILNQPLRQFLPYVALGMIAFNLLSGLTRASATVFLNASGSMKSTRQPLSSFVLKGVAIEFIQFGHNILLYFVFLVIGLVPLTPRALLAIPVALVIAVNGLFAGLWLGTVVARFRDVNPLVNSVLQVWVFFTPVFYRFQDLQTGARRYVLDLNPFTHLLSVFRAPLIGAPLASTFLIGSAIVTGVNVVLGLLVFARSRSRLPYWVA